MSHVLIVEDDPGVAQVIREGLCGYGHDCTSTETGEPALTGLDPTKVDVVISDMVLPGGISGIDIADRAAAAGIACVLITGHDESMFGLDRTDRIWLRKPFRLAELAAAVDAVLQKSKT